MQKGDSANNDAIKMRRVEILPQLKPFELQTALSDLKVLLVCLVNAFTL